MIVTKTIVRLDHPTEEGSWVEFSVPLTAGEVSGMPPGSSNLEFTLDLLMKAIVNWSETVPVTLENLRCVDLATYTWLANSLTARGGLLRAGDA